MYVELFLDDDMEQDENDGFFVPHGYLSSDEEQHDENGKWIDFFQSCQKSVTVIDLAP